MNHLRNIGKGQASLIAVMIVAATTIIGSAFTAWATANGSIADIRTEVRVVQERENNHYAEVQKRLDEISRKLDQAPWARNSSIAQ